MTSDILTSRLERIRKTGPDFWLANCPAHNDRSPSLSIRETAEGKLLVHCFAGCSVHEIMDAAGLDFGDQFPPMPQHGKPERRPFPATDALHAVAFEALTMAEAVALLAGQSFRLMDREWLILVRVFSNYCDSVCSHGHGQH